MVLQGLGLLLFGFFNVRSWQDLIKRDSIFKSEEAAHERLEDVANATEELPFDDATKRRIVALIVLAIPVLKLLLVFSFGNWQLLILSLIAIPLEFWDIYGLYPFLKTKKRSSLVKYAQWGAVFGLCAETALLLGMIRLFFN